MKYIGIDPPAMVKSNDGRIAKQSVVAGVSQAFDEWKRDPHGTGPALAMKRTRRNPWDIPQSLFYSDADRNLSRVAVAQGEDGSESLTSGSTQPWG